MAVGKLVGGGQIEFIARSKGSGRGFTADDLVLDECQALTDDEYEALSPAVSAAPSGNPQQIMTGTPPGPKEAGTIFRRVRADALSGKSKRTSWLEWSFDRDADLDDEEQWYRANPALGSRMSIETVQDERATFDDDSFARERGGVWATLAGHEVISQERWAACEEAGAVAPAEVAFGVDVAPDRGRAAIAAAGLREDGLWHVESVEVLGGTAGLAARLEYLCARNQVRAIVLDSMSPAASILDELRSRKLNVTLTYSRDMAAACGLFFDAVWQEQLRHIGQPQLSVALNGARKRPLGDAWAWNRKNAFSDITPVVASTLALWGAQTSRARRPMRTGQQRVRFL